MPILPAFMFGVFAADLEVRGKTPARLIGLLCVLALCVALALEPKDSAEFFRQDQLGWQLVAFCFVLAAGALPWLRSCLSLQPIVWIGLASYSVYLVHEPVIALLEHNSGTSPWLAATIAIACGIAFWAFFERPFVATRLKDKLVAIATPVIRELMMWLRIEHSVMLKRELAESIVLITAEPEKVSLAKP